MLNGKTALITGASRGLGRAIAVELAKAGAGVVLLARSADGLKETEALVRQTTDRVSTIRCDLSADGEVAAAMETVADQCSSLDILVNNAGVIEPLGPFADVDLDDWIRNLTINVAGTARITHRALPMLRRAPSGGVVVTISSGAAVSNIAGWSGYCTAKSALDRFAMVLDAELKASGVRSFSFAPGTIETRMQRSIRSTGVGPARLVSGEVEHLPPETPARAVVFLCTPEAAALAGEHIDIRYPRVREALGLPPLP